MRVIPPRVLVVACAALFLPAVASADPDDRARAAASFHRGQVAYARHDYGEAAAAFELAAGFDPNAVALLDAADAWALAGQPLRAAAACDRALAMSNLTAEQRRFADSRLAAVSSSIGTLDIEGTSDVRVVIDDGAEVPAPVHRRVATGRHVVRMRSVADGRIDEQDVVVGGGETTHLVPSLRARTVTTTAVPPSGLQVAPPPPAPTSYAILPTGTWIAFGVAVAAAGTAGVLGGVTLHERNAFNETPTHDNADSFYRARAATDIAWGAAAAGVVTGGLVWILSPKHADTQSAIEVGRGVGYRLSF